MNILVLGSGGREHALAWKISQSPRLAKLYIAPGNAGTAELGENVDISPTDTLRLATFCREKNIDLVVFGPEEPLAAGVVDELQRVNIPCFGPRQNAAQIEASKAFAKAFMQRHSIPTGRHGAFRDYEQALMYLHSVEYPVVLKASGLAAGKGVLIPETIDEAIQGLRKMMISGEYGQATKVVIIEERLQGEEISLMAFSDGATVLPMPPAQDYKRLLDNDRGPNTGGMGAYAPAPICPPEMVNELMRTVLQPTLDGLRKEGATFVGVLYAGLILTKQGPQVLEFNCRFGDPETQVVLPLLESDLVEIMLACIEGRLCDIAIDWRSGAAVTVVLASENYPARPSSGQLISGLGAERPSTMTFHAGARRSADQLVTAGGRILAVTGWGESLQAAHGRAYGRIQGISFPGMQYRKDIGKRAIDTLTVRSAQPGSAYASSGVDIQAGNRAVELMTKAVRSTYGPQVLLGIGAFGGLYAADGLLTMQTPVLVASTDGVGTKVKLAAQAKRFETIGQDLVNHCINDILVQGARPLFFLDYFASASIQPEMVAAVVSGVAAACRQAGIALLGGETAEMPSVYAPNEFDLAGTIVGVVEKSAILPRAGIRPGDVLIGLASSGPHTNGYSLIRKVFDNVPLDTVFPDLDVPLADALLTPHRSYLSLLGPLLEKPEFGVKALAHLTGGGFIENIPRILPEGVGAAIRKGSWPIPPLFTLIHRRGQVPSAEMYHVFNMGVGMVVILPAENAEAFQSAIPEETWLIGEVVAGERKVILI